MPFFRRKSETTNKGLPLPQSAPPGPSLSRTPSNRSSKSVPHSPGTPDSWNNENDLGLPVASWNGSASELSRPGTLLLSESVLQDGKDIPPNSLESPIRTTSRLSKTLLEVLHDKDALSCFIAFMKMQKSDQVIQFWCEADSFEATTLMRMRTHALQSVSKGTLHKRRSGSNKNIDFATLPSDGQGHLKEDAGPSLQYTHSSPHPPEENPGQNINSNIQSPNQQAVSPTEISAKPNRGSHSRRTKHSSLSESYCDSTKDAVNIENTSSRNVPVDGNQKNARECLPTDHRVHDTIDTKHSCVVSSDNITQDSCHFKGDKQNVSQAEKQHVCSTEGSIGSSSITDNSPSAVLPTETRTRSVSESAAEDMASKLRKSIERDAVKIFSTYIAQDSPRPLGVDDKLRSLAISKICMEDGQVDPECFTECQKFALDRLESEFFQQFKDSEFYCKHQINVLTAGKVYLPDILLCESALCYFMEYTEQEGGSDLLQMWFAADNFEQQLLSTKGSYDKEQAQNDAMVIYDRYFSLQATHPIGFDDSLRFLAEENICREDGPLPDCFTKAKNVVLRTLDKQYFSGYLQSQIYYRFLSDLVTTVEMAEDMHTKPHNKGHRRTESDASSEHSMSNISTGAEGAKPRNTLLAVDTRRIKKGTSIDGDFSMNMDMFNPDDLWQRESTGMSLGRVDALGQFVSNFEPDGAMDKKLGSRFLTRRKGKEKEQEQVALQIAGMIINDVLSLAKPTEDEDDS